ncbi:MAG: DUF6382 domain-containing protein [Eubacteriales bacterium]
MREISYNHFGNSTSLVLKLNPDDRIDGLSMGMMTNNEIQGLLSVRTRYINSEVNLYYDVSSLVPMTSAYHILCQDKYLMQFLLNFCRLIKECEAYLLDRDKLLLAPDYFYVQLTSAETYAVFLPLENAGENGTPFSFVKELVSKISAMTPHDSVIMPILYRIVIAEEAFSVDSLEKQLVELQTSGKMRRDTRASDGAAQPAEEFPKNDRAADTENRAPAYTEQPQNSAGNTVPKQTDDEKGNDNGLMKFFGGLTGSSGRNAAKEPTQKEKNSKGLSFGGFGSKKKPQQDDSFTFAVPDMNGGEVPQAQKETPAPEAEEKKQPSVPNPFAKAADSAPVQKQSSPVMNNPVQQNAVQKKSVPQSAQNGSGGGYTYSLDGMDSGASLATSLMDDSDDGEKKLALIRRANGQHTVISHNNFHIGHGKGMVDLYVDSQTRFIGTDHAYIMIQGNAYFIIDNNSRNHTWVNGIKIASLDPCPIHAGDVLRLADEYFDVVDS